MSGPTLASQSFVASPNRQTKSTRYFELPNRVVGVSLPDFTRLATVRDCGDEGNDYEASDDADSDEADPAAE